MTPFFVFLTGGFGAAARFGADKGLTHLLNLLRQRLSSHPGHQTAPDKRLWGGWAIVAVNLTGCFLVGWVATSPLLSAVSPVLLAGFLGGYTTFSTAIMDTIGYTFKPRFSFKYAFFATLIIGSGIFASIGSALLGAALNTGKFPLPF